MRPRQRDAARVEIARLAELRDALAAAKDAYWSEQVGIQHTAASAWLSFAEGRRAAALQTLAVAAAAEDRTEKATGTPGPLIPAREQYGTMLLDNGMPRGAGAAAEAGLERGRRRA